MIEKLTKKTNELTNLKKDKFDVEIYKYLRNITLIKNIKNEFDAAIFNIEDDENQILINTQSKAYETLDINSAREREYGANQNRQREINKTIKFGEVDKELLDKLIAFAKDYDSNVHKQILKENRDYRNIITINEELHELDENELNKTLYKSLDTLYTITQNEDPESKEYIARFTYKGVSFNIQTRTNTMRLELNDIDEKKVVDITKKVGVLTEEYAKLYKDFLDSFDYETYEQLHK